jgi:fused signal recognition particle receptor
MARQFGVPIRYVGIGEGLEDLQEFSAAEFLDALVPTAT